jgi:hypothetical protein
LSTPHIRNPIIRPNRHVSIIDHSHNREGRSLDKIATAESNGQDKLSLGNEPLLRVDILVAEITTHKLEFNLRPLAGGEFDLL